mgnify:FL=1
MRLEKLSEVEEWNTAYVFRSLADPEVWEQTEASAYNLRKYRKETLTKDLNPVRPDANSPASGVFGEAAVNGDTEYIDENQKLAASTVPLTAESAEGQQNPENDLDSNQENINAPRVLSFVDKEVIAHAFSPEGLLGRLYEDYETREEQREMALAVHKAISQSCNLAVEAGTGVGKSMAYLVPLVFAAKENGITVGVATKTNALLDQLVHKELPLLSSALGITYAPLKGFNHYPLFKES